MPELPEVETVKNSLALVLIGRVITDVQVRTTSLRYPLNPELKNITNTQVTNLSRRAKYLIINLNHDRALVLHLGMSGRLTINPQEHQLQKHDHFICQFDNNTQLIFNDSRRFGMIYLFTQRDLLQQKIFQTLGPEPLTKVFNSEYLKSKITNKRIAIKNLIMNNNIVVGIGNIYACESLFRAQIHPLKPSNLLTDIEIQTLIHAIKDVLTMAIKAGGTTLKDFINSDHNSGYFQQKLLVYGKTNKQCLYCKTIISRITQAGRSSFYCSNCQHL